MPTIATRSNASARAYGWSATVPESLDGMVLMMPTSISSTGTGNSSSIGANGSVTFSSCASISLNGVFTSDYDNYIIAIRHSSTANEYITFKMRASGTDNSSVGYVSQNMDVSGGTISASRTAASIVGRFATTGPTQRCGDIYYIYGPYLAQATAGRNTNAGGYLNARLEDIAATHNQAVAYDGITLFATSLTGLISVYGLEK